LDDLGRQKLWVAESSKNKKFVLWPFNTETKILEGEGKLWGDKLEERVVAFDFSRGETRFEKKKGHTIGWNPLHKVALGKMREGGKWEGGSERRFIKNQCRRAESGSEGWRGGKKGKENKYLELLNNILAQELIIDRGESREERRTCSWGISSIFLHRATYGEKCEGRKVCGGKGDELRKPRPVCLFHER